MINIKKVTTEKGRSGLIYLRRAVPGVDEDV